MNKCFLPHGNDLGTVFYPCASLKPQPRGKVPGGLLTKQLSYRHSLKPALSKTQRQSKEAAGAAGVLGPHDVCLSV